MISTAKNLSTFALAMLITGSIDNIRNLPTTALFGSTLIFFLVFAAVVFLLPTAFISAQLSSAYPEEGGVYNWVKKAFGRDMANLAIWLQWINTMVWFPTVLSFIAGTAAFLFAPHLAEHKTYLVVSILSITWLVTLVNLRGLQTSTRLATWCAVFGMILPMTLIIVLAGVWLWQGKPLHLTLTAHNLLPDIKHSQSWISLTAIMASFLGMELATVHVNQVSDAQHKFPRALLLSVVIILITMLCGSLAIAFVMPAEKIQLVDGVMQAFSSYFQAYHLGWLLPALTIMLLVGSFGGMINWVISPAKGLLQAARDSDFPEFITRMNAYRVPANLLILQAIIISLMTLAFLLMPSVNGSYWLLTDLSTQLYMLMYLFMFLAAYRLSDGIAYQDSAFVLPGRGRAMKWVAALGFVGAAISIAVGFIPPSNIDVGGTFHFILVFTGGMVLMVLPVLFFHWRK